MLNAWVDALGLKVMHLDIFTTTFELNGTFIGALHTTCPVWPNSYLQPSKNLSLTALKLNPFLQPFPGQAAIPEAAHLHPDEQRRGRTL